MSADQTKLVTGVIIDDEQTFTITEVCQATRIDNQLLNQLVEYHIIQPINHSTDHWEFDCVSLRRIRLARNFYHDLEVNLQGIALILDMMDKIETLESKLSRR